MVGQQKLPFKEERKRERESVRERKGEKGTATPAEQIIDLYVPVIKQKREGESGSVGKSAGKEKPRATRAQ